MRRADSDTLAAVTTSLPAGDAWNLEFCSDRVLSVSVEVGGGQVGTPHTRDCETVLQIAQQCIEGDFDALRAQSWRSPV